MKHTLLTKPRNTNLAGEGQNHDKPVSFSRYTYRNQLVLLNQNTIILKKNS
jgi:hypothetical protein